MTEPTPAEIEATEPDSLDIAYKGQTYAFPAAIENAPGEVLEAMEDEKIATALKILMSEGDWARFKRTKPTVKDYAELFDAYLTVIGSGSTGE